MDNFLNDIKRLKSIADIGLLYAKDPYDRERYKEIHNISLSMMVRLTDTPLSKWRATTSRTSGFDSKTPVKIRLFLID